MFSEPVFLLLLAMLQWNDWVDLRGLHKALIAQLVSSRGKERGKKRGRDGGGMLEEGGGGATFNELPMLGGVSYPSTIFFLKCQTKYRIDLFLVHSFNIFHG